MMTVLLKVATRFLMAAMLVVGLNASGVTIYDNSTGDLTNRFDPGLLEIGDEVLLGSPESYLTSFAFEYWALNAGGTSGTFTGIDVRLRFYLNDGPTFNGYATPGTAFYDSGWIDSVITTPTNRATLNFNHCRMAWRTGYLDARDVQLHLERAVSGHGRRRHCWAGCVRSANGWSGHQ